MLERCNICTAEDIFDMPDFPLSLKYSRPRAMVNVSRLHSHEFVEFVLVIGGYGIHQVNDDVSPIAQGDVLAIPAQVRHSYASDDRLLICNIMFCPSILGDTWDELRRLTGLKALLEKQNIIHLTFQKYQKLKELVHSLLQELRKRRQGYKIYSLALLQEFLMEVARIEEAAYSQAPSELSEVRQNINAAALYISENYQQDIAFDDLSRKVSMGRSSFFAKFKQLTGLTPLEYQTQYRIEKAKNMLRTTNYPVYQIAQKIGFNDTSYMIKQFKKYEKTTPICYRDSLALEKV